MRAVNKPLDLYARMKSGKFDRLYSFPELEEYLGLDINNLLSLIQSGIYRPVCTTRDGQELFSSEEIDSIELLIKNEEGYES